MTEAGDCIRSVHAGAIVAEFDRVLILETSGRVGQVALASGDQVLAERRLAEAHRRASDLALAVDQLLKTQGWKAGELTDVIVGLGPGSYTGLRVGLASAKALAYAVGCRFIGVETFAAIAMRTAVPSVSVIGDALKGKLFCRDYRRTSQGELEAETPLQIAAAEAWRQSLSPHAIVTGPAAEMFEVPRMSRSECEPRPVDLLQVARNCAWAITNDMWLAEPLYLRGSSAEEKLTAKL